MSQTTTHLIANNVPATGFGPPDSRSVPCSGVSRRAITFSSGSSLGDCRLLTRVKFICHKRVSNAASVLRGARPGSYLGNPDFNRNWNEDEDNNDEGPDESDILDSKNGTLFSSSKSEAYALPGQTEKEIHEFFVSKVEPKLRERTAGKDVHMAETVEGKDNEVVESIMNLLRSDHFSHIRASNNWSAAYGQKAISNTRTKGRSRNHSIPNWEGMISSPEPNATSVPGWASTLKYQLIYSGKGVDTDLGETQQPELDKESESDEEFKSEQDLGPGLISSIDEGIFAVTKKGKRLKEENSVEAGDQQPTEHDDLGSLKLAELRELAKSRGMKGYSNLKKSELVELLSGN